MKHKFLFSVFIIFFILVFVALGSWQIIRLEWKNNLISEIERSNNINLKDFFHYLPERTLYPTTLIEYERSRFDSLEGNVRYNIDTNITTTLGYKDFLISKQKIYLNHSIFEIKSEIPEFFPVFLKHLKLNPSSFSKFAWGKDMVDKVIV